MLLPTDSADAFGDLVDPFRAELLAHCYRMLGTIDEAEDAVQDTLARAWQGRHTYRRSISFRAWLYRIATNACLNAIERRKRDRRRTGRAIGPVPDHLVTGATPAEAGPEARYDARESISLAFLTVLHVLPPRQRAVLLLRDVLTLRAAEVAEVLDMSVPAVNSALQRARATLRSRYEPPERTTVIAATDRRQLRGLLDRYVRAWEASDVAGLVALLREDALLSMPPRPSVIGAQAIGSFVASEVFTHAPLRLIETGANGAPAFVVYTRAPAGARYVPFTLIVIVTDGLRIGQLAAYSDPRLIARFDLPVELAG